MEQILISKDNCINILKGFVEDLQNKINNKDLATPYIDQFNKAGLLKTDGNGDMFLCNNGEYIKIDLNQLSITEDMVNTVYDLFKITKNTELTWSSGQNIPYYTNNFSAEYYENNIYVIGGSCNTDYINKNIRKTLGIYNIINNKWTYGSDMPVENRGNASLIYNNCIYYKGTINSNLYKYDIASDTWNTISTIIENSDNIYIRVYKNKIYCISPTINKVYDIQTNTWSSNKPSMIKNVTSCDSIIYNGKIYIIGGSDGHNYLNVVQIYDIETDSWTTGTNLNVSNGYMSSVLYKNKIYCTGGFPTNNKIFIYNIDENKWETEIIMSNLKYAHKAVNNKNKIYLIGGCINDSITYSYTTDILSLPYIDYDIKLPEELDDKLNIIKSDGLGNKLLADNGLYIDPSNNYKVIENTEINNLVNIICNKEG